MDDEDECILKNGIHAECTLYYEKLSIRLESLFSFTMVKTLITILFRDMDEDYKKFHSNGDESDEFDEDPCENVGDWENNELIKQV